jgi:hypothetical protein
MWYARRRSDNKEFLACSIFINRKTGESGINGTAADGERASLPDGTYCFYRR